MTLKQYCQQAGLDLDAAVRKLNDNGYKASPDMTMRAIADSAGVRPSQVRAVIESSGKQ